MGSYRKAIMTGFICRLCSEHKSVVIHVYSKRAKNMDLLEKITLLPINIKKYDKLPKTICEDCIENLCRQFELVQQVRKTVEIQMRHRMLHTNGCPAECPLDRSRTSPTVQNQNHEPSSLRLVTATAAITPPEIQVPDIIISNDDITYYNVVEIHTSPQTNNHPDTLLN